MYNGVISDDNEAAGGGNTRHEQETSCEHVIVVKDRAKDEIPSQRNAWLW